MYSFSLRGHEGPWEGTSRAPRGGGGGSGTTTWGAKKSMRRTAMGHARSMRDHWEPCHEWFLGASLGFRGLHEAAGAANGQGRLWEAV